MYKRMIGILYFREKVLQIGKLLSEDIHER